MSMATIFWIIIGMNIGIGLEYKFNLSAKLKELDNPTKETQI